MRKTDARRKSVEQSPESARLPDFVIVGAQKSGTSSLRLWLNDHPEVWCANEPHYFCHNLHRGVDWYRSRFATEKPARLLGDKTPDYMHRKAAIDEMSELLPDAKLIAILRDPVTRAYSHYWHNRRDGTETLSFADALSAEQERLARDERRFGYVSRGRYEQQLRYISTRYRREALLVLLFEELEAHPRASFELVCQFLQIDASIIPPSVGTTANAFYQRDRGLRGRLLSSRFAQRRGGPGARLLGRIQRAQRYPPMPDSARARLTADFAGPNTALAEWLGRPLSDWTHA